MNTEIRELNVDEVEAVAGGLLLNFGLFQVDVGKCGVWVDVGDVSVGIGWGKNGCTQSH